MAIGPIHLEGELVCREADLRGDQDARSSRFLSMIDYAVWSAPARGRDRYRNDRSAQYERASYPTPIL